MLAQNRDRLRAGSLLNSAIWMLMRRSLYSSAPDPSPSAKQAEQAEEELERTASILNRQKRQCWIRRKSSCCMRTLSCSLMHITVQQGLHRVTS